MLCVLLLATPLLAQEDDLSSLELYNGETTDVVHVDRAPRPASLTAENITVVTASEIAALNAHTLADILHTVTGIQFSILRTPGSFSSMRIQGSRFNHILVLIDGVPINILAENTVDLSSIPVQMIERVEIVKGAASTSWGSALGGVVNVITKSPDPDRPVGGLVSGSYGKRDTIDLRAEASGTVNRFGYYLNGGRLSSDGLLPHNYSDNESAYGKLQYELPVRGLLTLTAGWTDSNSGQVRVEQPLPLSADQSTRQLIGSLTLQYPLMDRLSLQAMLRARKSDLVITGVRPLPPPAGFIRRNDTEENAYGVSLLGTWVDDLQRIVLGVDYDRVEADLTGPLYLADHLSAQDDRVGVYLRDIFMVGRWAFIPGGRFDRTETGGQLWSGSFGITYAPTDNAVLRFYLAKGYSLTSLNRNNSTDKVLTYQLGFETSDIPYLWVKGTVFRNDTDLVIVQSAGTTREESQLKTGLELELRTTPVFDTSASLGYTYIDARNDRTDLMIQGVARHTFNLGLRYDNPRLLRALLFGHYIDWNDDVNDRRSNYSDMIWDLHLGKEFRYSEHGSVEIFGSLRNLFNGKQYQFPYRNPDRWGEVGVRCVF